MKHCAATPEIDSVRRRNSITIHESAPPGSRYCRTQAVPLGTLGLSTTGEVGRTRADDDAIGFLHAREQLPPLPAVAMAFADETRVLPAAAVHAHLDTRNRVTASRGRAFKISMGTTYRPASDHS